MKLLTRAAQYDLCTPSGTTPRTRTNTLERPHPSLPYDIAQWLYPAALPNGQHIALLKVLQSNMCQNNCGYCGMRRSRNVQRCEFRADELAAAFAQLAQRRVAQGLFLSSAICGNVSSTQERMIATVELLRFKYQFTGYIHLKLLPGCEAAAVERAVQIADRVSVNLEAPNAERLARLSADKRFEQDLMQPIFLAKHFIDQDLDSKTDLTTQFVVGAARESDREVLATVERLHRDFGLTRAYFSRFQPISDTPLENLPATPLVRQNRLYQGDYLLRFYGFTIQDLTFDGSGNLRSDLDPKMAWAQRHPEFFPVEINRASREELLRVPGVGPRSVARILRLRRQGRFRYIEDLRAIGAAARRAAPFILLDGRRPPQQLRLMI
ncbi:MAG: helix-hairpin-helix domain-containing protein [Anaerolineales bacterium]|nr:MAG: helix-hairpin-helix domain-containing protein [Anaerolineales bacterium]